ncbi:MAG: hypothetical protein SFV21_21265 [Rhodospirillaceae bacterium]|nr:hypothetical protein [Rhodospirillaceae bacterium]
MANEPADKTQSDKTHTAPFIKSDVDDVVMLGQPMTDNLVTSMQAMGAEVWALWRRMRVMEKLLAEKGITQPMIENYVPSEADTAAWQTERDAFIVRTIGPLSREGHLKVGADWPKKS